MSSVEILLPMPLQRFIIEAIDAKYTVHKLWESENPEALIERVKNNVAFLMTSPDCKNIDGPFMSRFPNLKAVVNFGVGYNSIDAQWAGEHGIIVTHTPNVLNDEVADLAMGLLIATVRQIPQADAYVRAGKWEKAKFPLSPSLAGRTMGILGLGRIGKAIAKRAEAFGLKVIYHGRHAQPDVPYAYCETPLKLAQDSDILMVVAPGSAETNKMVNREILRALGPNGILINVARGVLIDEDALIEALEKHEILSAGLDVYTTEPHVDQRLVALPHIVLLPHVGSASDKTVHAIGQLVLDNLEALIQGKPPLTPVPETPFG